MRPNEPHLGVDDIAQILDRKPGDIDPAANLLGDRIERGAVERRDATLGRAAGDRVDLDQFDPTGDEDLFEPVDVGLLLGLRRRLSVDPHEERLDDDRP